MSKIDMIIERIKVAPPEVVEQVYALMEKIDTTTTQSSFDNPKGIDDLIGALKDSKAFQGDPVEIQRAMRDEWD